MFVGSIYKNRFEQCGGRECNVERFPSVDNGLFSYFTLEWHSTEKVQPSQRTSTNVADTMTVSKVITSTRIINLPTCYILSTIIMTGWT